MATEVATAADLNNVRNSPSGSYIQVNNIDMSGWGNWSPIENFNGHYDGGGYGINNLTCSEGSSHGALFGGLFGDGVLENIRMNNANVSGGLYTALLVSYYYNGISGSKIYNCIVKGTVNGTRDLGGLVGNVYQSADVPGNQFTIEKCAVIADLNSAISPAARGGGLIGTFSYVWATAFPNVSIENCYVRVNWTVPSDHTIVGGFLGTDTQNANTTIENCYTASTVTAGSGTSNLVGFAYEHPSYPGTVTVSNCYYDLDLWGYTHANEQGASRTTDAMTYPENFTTTYIGWDFVDIWKHDPAYTINNGYPHFEDIGFNIWVKKSGVWEPVTDIWVKKGGVWQAVTDVSTLKGGSWNTV